MPKSDERSIKAPHRLAFAALLTGTAALAFGAWLVRLADTGPVAAAFWRVALAVPFLLLLTRAVGQPLRWPGRTLFIAIAAAAFFFAADLAAWHLSIRLTKLGNATLFGNVSSFAFAAWGLWLVRRWPSPMQALALLLAATGSVLLMAQSAELSAANLRGDLLALLAGVLYGVYLILVERARATVEPLPLLVLASSIGAICLLPAALAMGERVMPHNWTPLIALALLSQVVGQGLLVFAIGELSPLVVGLALLTQPAIAAAIGWSVYGERLGWRDWTGAAAIGVALLLVRLRPAPAEPT
ncbi:DMT family transporter [Sphingomonas sp.]|uniref:DMT family transporter n=1 Tax=Sphingomonas sp. TaxID=28214 RepID=UPI00325FA27C